VVKLTALVCAHNQEDQLSACLRRLSFCDEIVVVADRCTDRSQDIARRHGAIVIDGIFPMESQRKAAGAAACTGEWILEVDADEEIDPALAFEIRVELQRPPAGDWFDTPIDNYIGETRVRHGWAGPLSSSRDVRLYRRGAKQWKSGARIGGGVVASNARAGALTGAIRRTLGRDVGGLIERLNRLTAIAAEDMADAKRVRSPAGGIAHGLSLFLESYLGRRGWREGRAGVLVAALNAVFPLVARLRARDLVKARRQAADAGERGSIRRIAAAH
jgi:glycosyltransferase involved in cell wall biosynthesis